MMNRIVSAVTLLSIAGLSTAFASAIGCQAPPVTAPELDPASLMTGLTLLAGGLVLIRGRGKPTSKD